MAVVAAEATSKYAAASVSEPKSSTERKKNLDNLTTALFLS